MKTREPLYPEFEISKTSFSAEVLEHFFDVLHSQPKNNRDSNDVVHTVATKLDELWLLGDARIPRNTVTTIKRKIVAKFYETFAKSQKRDDRLMWKR